MAVIGSLALALTMGTRGVDRGVKQTLGLVGQLKSGVSTASGAFLKFGGILAGIAGAAGVAALVKSEMAAIDATAKVADRLGIATESLIGMRHAANLAGVGNAEFDKSLETMVRRLGEAKQGTGEAVKGLDTIGLTLADLQGLSADQQFAKIADGIAAITDPAEQAAAAYQFFGRSGQNLINTLAGGSAGLAEASAEAERLGTTFSRIDAAKVELANDNITRLGESIRGFATSAAIAIAPAVAKMAAFATDGIVRIRQTILPIVGSIVTGAIEGFKAFAAFMAPYWAALAGTIAAFGKFVWQAISGVVSGILSFLPSFESMGGGLLSILTSIRDGVVSALLVAEFAFTNWREIAEFVFVRVSAEVVEFANVIGYQFGTVIPTWFNWLADNAGNILVTFGANTLTFFENLFGNIASLVSNLPDLIAGNLSVGDLWKPLSDGFLNTIEELPKIPEREMGALESALKSEASRLGESLSTGFDTFMGDRLAQIGAQAGAITSGIGSALDMNVKLPEIPKLSLDPDSEEAIEGFGDKNQFRQISLSRVALDGVQRAGNRPQKVEDPESPKQTAILQNLYDFIRQNPGGARWA